VKQSPQCNVHDAEIAATRVKRDMASLHKPVHELRHRDVPVSGFDEGAGVISATYNDAVIE
jgi:hypothetical protein